MISGLAAFLPTEASCLHEMFFSNSPMPAVATTLPTQSGVSTSMLGSHCQPVIFPKKEPGALLLTDLQVTRSLTVTVPSLADAMSPAPEGGHTSHLAFPSTVRE